MENKLTFTPEATKGLVDLFTIFPKETIEVWVEDGDLKAKIISPNKAGHCINLIICKNMIETLERDRLNNFDRSIQMGQLT